MTASTIEKLRSRIADNAYDARLTAADEYRGLLSLAADESAEVDPDFAAEVLQRAGKSIDQFDADVAKLEQRRGWAKQAAELPMLVAQCRAKEQDLKRLDDEFNTAVIGYRKRREALHFEIANLSADECRAQEAVQRLANTSSNVVALERERVLCAKTRKLAEAMRDVERELSGAAYPHAGGAGLVHYAATALAIEKSDLAKAKKEGSDPEKIRRTEKRVAEAQRKVDAFQAKLDALKAELEVANKELREISLAKLAVD